MDSSSTASSPVQQQAQQQPAAGANGPQIRSRITVVCAECKRLKLKCDRRTPCGSCTKRDTVARCVYSPAASEKVDLHSLNNRLIQVESQLAQFGVPGSRSHNHYPAGHSFLHNDRALLAVGHSGSSLAISLDDVSAIWLDELDLSKNITPGPSLGSSAAAGPSGSQVKLEPSPVSLPSPDPGNNFDLPLALLMPSMDAYYASSSPSPFEAPSVTPYLVGLLPSSMRKRHKLYDTLEEVLKMHPCINWKHFKERAESMFKWANEVEGADGMLRGSGSGSSRPGSSTNSKAEAARAIFFGTPSAPPLRGPASPRPTISFFAAVAAAFALGTLLDKEIAAEGLRMNTGDRPEDGMNVDDASPSGRPPLRKRLDFPSGKKSKNASKIAEACSSPAGMYALSQQALNIFQTSSTYDLDYLTSSILQVLFLLHDGKPRVAHELFPLVGKMINIARMMGLAMDPDEFPGKYNLFEAEIRRRVWWDIYYYDLYVSDYMGHPPLIPDNSYTTRMPLDVDEELFIPTSQSIPVPRSPLEPDSCNFTYFVLKCRLAQLVKNLTKRSFRDPLGDPDSGNFSIEQATVFESEVKQLLAELPSAYRLAMDNTQLPSDNTTDSPSSLFSVDTSSVSAILMAQRCELAITANRLILKLYLPFLRSSAVYDSTSSQHQAALGTINAAYVIIYASRVLYSMWKHRIDLRSRRPSPAIFEFYTFGRTLFDAAVVCAHGVIKQPSSVWAKTAMEQLDAALEVMRDPMLVTGRGSTRGGVDGGVSEAVKIVEILKKKAEAARAGSNETCGMKRKHDDVDAEMDKMLAGFSLPYVGSAIASAGLDSLVPPAQPTSATPQQPPQDTTANEGTSLISVEPPSKDARKPTPIDTTIGSSRREPGSTGGHTKKDKHAKKAPYPVFGIRVRFGKDGLPLPRYRVTPTSAPVESNGEQENGPRASQSVSGTIAHNLPPSHASSPIAEAASQQQESQQRQLNTSDQAPSPFPQSQSCSSLDTRMLPPMTPDSLNSANVDFSMPFRNPDQGQMDVDMRSRKFSSQDLTPNMHCPPTFGPVMPSHASSGSLYEPTHGPSYASTSSPMSYSAGPATGSSGRLSSADSPYGGGIGSALSTPQFKSNLPLHEARSTPYREQQPSQPLQQYYGYETPYDGPMGGNDLVPLVGLGMNGCLPVDARDQGGTITGSDVPPEPMYRYPSEKAMQPMFPDKPASNNSLTPRQPQPFPPEPANQSWTRPPMADGPTQGQYWSNFKYYGS